MIKILKLAIIGCGRISEHHAKSIINSSTSILIAVCDLDPTKLNLYSNLFDIKGYTCYREMLNNHPEINTVVIITPSGMHYEHSIEIITKYKKNIIVEKPTFMKPSQVIEVYKKAYENDVQIFPIFQNRYNKAVQRVLKGIQNNELGNIRTISVRVRWCRPQKYYDLAAWRGTYSMDGGCLANQGIHHIDLLKIFCGEVTRLSCTHRTFGADIEVEDTAVAIMEFKNGAIGTLEITTAARPIDYEASITLLCENGLAQIGGIAVNELQMYTPDPKTCLLNSEDFSGNVYGNGHTKIYQEIYNASQNSDKKFPITMEDVYSTIQLLNAFYVADERQEWIDVSTAGDSVRLGCEDNIIADLYRIK
jgi:UDP-N-acetyl-2-amino-2-deoxyglucuronate dehydrogenase